jgi:hypothetical protein
MSCDSRGESHFVTVRRRESGWKYRLAKPFQCACGVWCRLRVTS